MATSAEEQAAAEQRRRAAAAAIAGGALVVAATPDVPDDVPPATARAAAAGAILAGIVAFLATQRARMRSWLTEQMRRRTPTAQITDIERVIAEEETRGAEFERRQAERFARDLTTALAIPDAAQREGAIRGLTKREERYARQRDEAMAARAFAAIDRVVLRVQSPTGAFWRLDPTVVEHTAGCLIMGGKFWPWQVLDRVHPPRHAGCPCRLIGYGEAIAEGLLAPGAVVDVQTALRRAAAVVMEGALAVEPADAELLIEAAGGRELLAFRAALVESGLVADEGVLDTLLSEFDPNQPRWPKGHPLAGQWRPKLGQGFGSGSAPATGKRAEKLAARKAKDLDELRAMVAPKVIGRRWDDELRQDVPVMGKHRSTEELAAIGASVATLAERYGTWRADRVRIDALHEERRVLSDLHHDRIEALGGPMAFYDREQEAAKREGREPQGRRVFEATDALRPPGESARIKAIDAEVGRLLLQEERGKRDAIVGVLAEVRPMGGRINVGNVVEEATVGAPAIPAARAEFDASMDQVRRLLPADWIAAANLGRIHFELSDKRAWHRMEDSGLAAARGRQERRIDAMLDEGAELVGYIGDFPVMRVPEPPKDAVFLPATAGFYLLSANGVPEKLPDNPMFTRSARRDWRYDSKIRVKADDPSTMLHELGHRIEQVYGEPDLSGYRPLLGSTVRFLRERAGGDELKALNTIRPGVGYEDHERVWEDEFVDPYIGKDYGGRTTEVLTMGLQMIFFPTYNRTLIPRKSNTRAKADEEMRNYILGLLAAL